MWKEGIVCRSDALSGFQELVRSLGGDADAKLREAGIDPKALKVKGNYICFLAFQRLLMNTALQLKRPDLGLIWAEQHKIAANNFGPVAVLLVISRDVKSFIESWIDYSHVHSTGTYTRLALDEVADVPKGCARITMQHSPAAPDTRQLNEACLLVFYKLFNDYSGLPDPVSRIGFPHKPMAEPSVYQKHFACPIEFNSDYAYIEFKSAVLDRKMGPTFNPGKRMFVTHIEKTLKKTATGKTSFSAHIGLVLPYVLGLGKSDAVQVAETLGISLRKMQRLLKEEGSTYTDILDEVRQEMSCQILRNSETSMTRIAHLLDYASLPAFSNAFKRWTGISPSDYRKSASNIDVSIEVIDLN